jgi:Spy/CpxP family protein refolding chaperone
MKKNVLIVLTICLMGSVSGVFAQRGPSDEGRKSQFEKFKTEREAFISKAMNLTDDEKKAFWPLCNELQIKKFELNKTLRDEMRQINQARRAQQAVPDANYRKVVELSAHIRVQEAELEQEYLVKFLQVIPAEKVFLYRQSEQNFGEKVVRERVGRNQRLSDNAHRHAERMKEYAQNHAKRAQERADRAKDHAEKAQKYAEKAQKQAQRAEEKSE